MKLARLCFLLLTPSLALAYEPIEKPCDFDRKANEALRQAAVDKARAVFPEAKALGECIRFGGGKQVRLAPLAVTEGGVRFLVESMLIDTGKGWELVPFADRKSVARVAVRILGEPLVKKLNAKSLQCAAATDAPGATRWYRCSPDDLEGRSTPSSGHLGGRLTEFEFAEFSAPPRGCDCQEFPLVNWSMPAALVPNDAPGWCTVRSTPEVNTFVKAHPLAQVTVADWHDYTVKLRATDGAEHEAPLETGQCYCSTPPACPK